MQTSSKILVTLLFKDVTKQTVVFSVQWKNKTVLVMNCFVKISLFSKRLNYTEHAIGLTRVRINIEQLKKLFRMHDKTHGRHSIYFVLV